MGLISGAATFFVVWWIVIFIVLPLDIRPPQAHEKVPGEMPGAPAAFSIKRKVILTTAITAVIWAVIFVIVHYRLLSVPDLPTP